MLKTRKLACLCAVLMLSGGLAACTTEMETDDIDFESGIRLTVIHTGDIHSRLLPYDMDLMSTDERIGMVQSNEPFGGIARAATLIRQIRAQAQHSVHVDSGDVFQGAPIFNEYNGEPEIYALNYLGLDAFIIGNHEFDNGVANLYDKLSRAQFTVLAANYQWKKTQGNELLPLQDVARPYTIINANGVKVGVIGMANFSSMSSSTYGDNNLGITVLENIQVVQSYIDLLKNDVNIMTMVTHLGLGEDEDVIRKTDGLDVVFGGHLHVVLNPPKIIPDGHVDEKGKAAPKNVPLVHSGAFMKYVGHFDGVFYPDYTVRPELYVDKEDKHEWDLTLVSHKYTPIPVDSTISDDAELTLLMAPYEMELARRLNLRYIVGYAPYTLKRFGTGGNDSPLGNFLADAMVTRQRVEADFGATNSLGIRTDIIQGPVTNDQLYNVFPFPNSIASMTLSGAEVWSLLDYNSYRSMNRGCSSQLQVSGVRYALDCHTAKQVVDDYLDMGYLFQYQYRADAFNEICNTVSPRPSYCDPDENGHLEYPNVRDENDPSKNVYYVHFAKDVKLVRGKCETDADCNYSENNVSSCELITDTKLGKYKVCLENLQPEWFYKFSTNNYMAHGGSGFSSLKYNTTQSDTGVALREILLDGIEKSNSCLYLCERDAGDAALQNAGLDKNDTSEAALAIREQAALEMRAKPGECTRLNNCKKDTTEFEIRWCKQLYRYSEQEVCLYDADGNGDEATRCVGLNKTTDYANCLSNAYYAYCRNEFKSSDLEQCYENANMNGVYDANGALLAEAWKCDTTALGSEYTRCVDSFLIDPKYQGCAGMSTESEYDKCVDEASAKAEAICMEVACFVAGTDGRQLPIKPHSVEEDGSVTSGTSSYSNGAAIMEALQSAGYDACY